MLLYRIEQPRLVFEKVYAVKTTKELIAHKIRRKQIFLLRKKEGKM